MSKFGLIGKKLMHSFSPLIHSRLGDYEYKLYPLERAELEGFVKGGGLDGFNVTIPYKVEVIPYLDRLTERARKIGSVNTVVRLPGGLLLGDNTDYYGFEYMLGGADISGCKALVLGSGGASRTVKAALLDRGVRQVLTVSRSGELNYETIYKHTDADIIVNTTPVGMYPDNLSSPIDLSPFKSCRLVLDVIFNPAKTGLLLQAEDLGIACKNGLSMLVAQAKAASELFTGRSIPEGKIDEITALIEGQTKNIALIGMPGSGKSSVGRLLARLTGRRFEDTDEHIVSQAGMDIPTIFSERGEEHFRRLETGVLQRLSKESGLVIATGGGIVTRAENLRLLRQNSVTVLIEGGFGELSTEGRPLSRTVGIEELRRQRQPLYLSWSQLRVVNVTPEQAAREIKESLKL
jgi:shikimate dehydrogenase